MDHYSSHSPNTVPSISLKDVRNQAQFQQSVAKMPHPSTSSQHVPTLSNKELRDKIVEILSTTANGCLTELGYFPGMTQRLHELEVTNQKWQAENVKLFEDNRNLLITVTDMRERESLMSTQDLDKINRVRNLELQLEAVKKDSIPKVKFDDLHKHFTNLRASYETAYGEVARLTEHLQNVNSLAQQSGLLLPPPPPRKILTNAHLRSDSQPFSSQSTPQTVQQFAPGQHPAPPGVWQGGQPIRGGGSAASTSMGGPAPLMAQRRHVSQQVGQNQEHHSLQSSQQGQEAQQQVQTSMNQPVYRSLVNAQNVYPSPHPQDHYSQSQMPGPMVPSPTTQLPQYQQQGNQHLPLSYPQFHSAPHDHQLISSNGQATSYPPNPYPPAASSPHSVQYPPNSYSPARSPLSVEYQAQQVPHQSPLHPGSRGSSTPLSLDTSMRPMKVEMPPTPLSASNLHSSSPFSAPMHPRQPQPGERQPSNRMSPRINTQTHHRPPQFGPPQTFPTPAQIQSLNIQEQHPSVEITTMSPNDMYINPPAMDEHQQGYAGPNEYVAPQQRPPEHLEHIQSGSTTPDEPSTHAPLKRNSVTMLEGAEFGEDSQKKPRLDDTSHQTSEQSYDEGSYMSAQSQRMYAAQDGSYGQIYAPAPSEPISAPLLHQSMSTYGMDSGMMYSDANTMEEEDMEYEVEVGPDGLRLVRDCLEEIFRTPEGGGRVCGLCLLRQQRNPNIEPPMPFINASDDDLEMHCLSEHEKAWTIARQVD